MYPFFRYLGGLSAARRAPRIGPFEPHVSTHRCWPWDLDPWMELNNGRTLTLYDLGRVPMVLRMGLFETFRKNGWGFTVAGNSVRYRRRIKAMQRFTQVSRMLGWDHRFLYMEQSIWTAGECCNHMMLRVAIVGGKGRSGIVPPSELIAALGVTQPSPPLPGWVQTWIESESQRPWPPILPAIPEAERTRDLPA